MSEKCLGPILITDSEKTVLLAKKMAEFYGTASKDVIRFTLSSVWLHVVDNTVRIFATDGHRLVDDTYTFTEAVRLLDPMPNPLMIVPDAFDSKMFNVFSSAKNISKKWVFGEDTKNTFCFSDGIQKITFRVDNYIIAPPVDSVIPRDSRPTDYVNVNAQYLIELVDSLKLSTKRGSLADTVVRLKFKKDKNGIDRRAPIVAETVRPIEGVKQVRVVMPVRD